MREMYQNEAEISPSSPESGQDKSTGLDPFYDRYTIFPLLHKNLKELTHFKAVIHKYYIYAKKK